MEALAGIGLVAIVLFIVGVIVSCVIVWETRSDVTKLQKEIYDLTSRMRKLEIRDGGEWGV